MLSTVFKNPPAYVSIDGSTCLAFERTHHTHRTYAIQLQRRNIRPVLLGCIEYNDRLGNWYLTHIGRNPIPKAESFPFLEVTETATYLYEDWQQKRQREVKAELAQA